MSGSWMLLTEMPRAATAPQRSTQGRFVDAPGCCTALTRARAGDYRADVEPGAGVITRVVSEAELARAWEERRYDASALVDDLGRRLQVVFPGRRWGGPGPDFRGAVIALPDATLLRGDVELHRRSSGWFEHGHAGDPAYSQVVLHVVHRRDVPTRDAFRRPIPTVALQLDAALAIRVVSPCLRHAPSLVEAVEAAGRARFLAHAARFEADLTCVDASQALWRGVAEALGYSANRAPFARLAELVPWSEAEPLVRTRGVEALAALLLGTGSLLVGGAPGEREAWEQLQSELGARRFMPLSAWERQAIRPANDPARRCRGLAELAARWCADPAGRSPAAQVCESIEAAVTTRRPALRRLVTASPWIGAGRARVIVTNVLLPIAYASGVSQALELYARLPGEPLNRPTRFMAAQLAGESSLRYRTACQRQGLLEIFKQACSTRHCERCVASETAVASR